jgi:ornithine--oxo-acid transaminase
MLEPKNYDIAAIFEAREAERFDIHSRHLNEQLVRVLRTIGYDVGFSRGAGQYLYERAGARYLDLLSGFGVFGIGRNHPALRTALESVLDAELPNLVQMDVAPLAGVLAERLLAKAPYFDKVFFANSGTETVEAAIKFARAATKRSKILSCTHAFHGLTFGALSLNGDEIFKKGFEPLLGDCDAVPFNDLTALETALRRRDVAAFIVEPIQGKGVHLPAPDYLQSAAELCRRYGSLFIADEIQCGLGRTGRFFAVEHWNVQPDMILLAKALSGGHVPIGALLTRKDIFDRLFNRMDRAVVHGSTFAKNDLAMAAGIATLAVLDSESMVENAARTGERLLGAFRAMAGRHEMLREARGLGLMIGVEFGAPSSLKLRASWSMIEAANKGLFCQLITIPLFKEHKILTQVAGHGSHTIKLLPSYVITGDDCTWIETAFDQVIGESHRVPGAIWSLGKTLIENAMAAKRAS